MTSRPTVRTGRKAVPDRVTDAAVHNRAEALLREKGMDTKAVAATVVPEVVNRVSAATAETVRNEAARHRITDVTVAITATTGMAGVPTGMAVRRAEDAPSRTRDVPRPELESVADVRAARPHRQAARRVVQGEAVARKADQDRDAPSPQAARKDLVVASRRMHVRSNAAPIVRTIRSSTPTTIRSMLRDIPTTVVDVATVPVDAAMAAAARQVVQPSEAVPPVTEVSRR